MPTIFEAWNAFYTLMQESLHSYVAPLVCAFRSGPKESSWDVVHEALSRFWQRWSKIKGQISNEAAACAYLKASCRNSLIDKYRHDRSAQPLVDFLSLKFSHTPEGSIVRGLLVQEVIAALGGECGKLLQSYVSDGLSLAEIADQEGVLPSALYSRWYRCLKKAQKFAEDKKRPKGFNL